MRPIKFRAWDKRDKVMREVYGIQFPKMSNHGNRTNTIIEMHCSDYEGQKAIILSDFTDNIDRVELMQFTGFLDKNGKEIYFEDFVEDEVGQIWVVKWNKTEISLLNISTGDIMSMRNNLLIKSNIYENSFNFTPKYTEIPPYPERSNN